MQKIVSLNDHIAWSCHCGCVGFNLLRSGKIECEGCGAQDNKRWDMNTLESLLRMTVKGENGVLKEQGKPCEVDVTPEFRVAVQNITDDGVYIIIHANGHNSDTLDFIVSGDELRPIE